VHRGVAFVAVALAAVLASGCGGSSASPKVAPETLLRQAKSTLDATSSVHFQLNSQGVSGGGTNLTGGEGDLARPDQLKGSFTVTVDGIGAPVSVVSKGGVFVAKLPFQTHYTRTSPASFGLSDPSTLLDPSGGLSDLLTAGTDAHYTGQERYHGELLEEITTTVPGSAVPVLPDAKPSQTVTLVAAINPSSYQTRLISLTGPFTNASSNSTYVVTLTGYNQPVTITLPAT
jgi:outer membrane lipoprotein-sorting protein